MSRFDIKRAVVVVSSMAIIGGLPAGLAHAQSSATSSAEQSVTSAMVTVHPLNIGAGNITITGSAIDGSQPASGVSVYDGTDADAPYLADVSMGDKALSAAASSSSFLLIMDSRGLADGPHLLRFEAHFPGGTSATTTAFLDLQNVTPYDPADTSNED